MEPRDQKRQYRVPGPWSQQFSPQSQRIQEQQQRWHTWLWIPGYSDSHGQGNWKAVNTTPLAIEVPTVLSPSLPTAVDRGLATWQHERGRAVCLTQLPAHPHPQAQEWSLQEPRSNRKAHHPGAPGSITGDTGSSKASVTMEAQKVIVLARGTASDKHSVGGIECRLSNIIRGRLAKWNQTCYSATYWKMKDLSFLICWIVRTKSKGIHYFTLLQMYCRETTHQSP